MSFLKMTSPPSPDTRRGKILRAIYDRLLEAYGPQHWWPAQTPLEVCVGAILVQNTNWQNVERAISNLRREKALGIRGLCALSMERMKILIRPAGYFNVKAVRLKNFLDFLSDRYNGDLQRLAARPWPVARAELLSVNGIGHETADSILLYALGKPVFVVDAYTKRLLLHHGFQAEARDYMSMQRLFMMHIAPDPVVYNEYHALIVRLGKQFRPGAYGGDDYPLKAGKYFLKQPAGML